MTVAENVAFGLEMRKLAEARRSRAASRRRWRWCGSTALGGRLPRQLSGGQQQRVALARALVIRPDVLLLDEPLSNLDAKLRQEVRVEIRELQRKLGLTTVMVTHDQEEALTMADRLVVMNEGAVRQIGSPAGPLRAAGRQIRRGFRRPHALSRRPRRGARRASAPTAASSSPASGGMPATRRWRCAPSGCASMPRRGARGLDNSFPGAVEFVSYLGSQVDLHVRLSPADRRDRADPEPAGAAAAGDRRSGPCRLEQVDRPCFQS